MCKNENYCKFVNLMLEDLKNEKKHMLFYLTASSTISGLNREEYKEYPFFAKLSDYLEHKWKQFNTSGYLTLAEGKLIPKASIENPTKNKILSYLIQSYETYYNVKTLKAVFDYLKDKQTKIVLYTYDSFLLDVSRKDGKKLLADIKNILENLGFPTKMKTGDNYGVLN